MLNMLPKIKIILLISLFLFGGGVFADIPVQSFYTKKKIKVLQVEDHSTEIATLYFAFKGAGQRADPPNKEGLTSLMINLLLEQKEGGKSALNKKLLKLGVLSGIQIHADQDNIVVFFKAPPEKLKEVFALIKTVLKNSDFDSKELDKIKNFDPTHARLATANERTFAQKSLMEKLFHGHPYAHAIFGGTLDGRQNVTLEDVKQCVKERFAINNLVFAVVGPVSKQNLSDLIDETFKDLPKEAVIPIHAKIAPRVDGSLTVIPKNSTQSGVVFAQPAVSLHDPDCYPLVILNEVLGGGVSSRIWMEAREKQGLVYHINTEFVDFDLASTLLGGFDTNNENVGNVINLVRTEWQKIHEKGVSEEEFKAAKTSLMGQFALNFVSPEGIAQYLLFNYLSGRPDDFVNKRNKIVEAITFEKVNQVAKARLEPKHLTFVVVGQPLNLANIAASDSKPASDTSSALPPPASAPIP